MINIKNHADPMEVRDAIRSWVKLLAARRYEEAADALFDSALYDAETIERTIRMYADAQSVLTTGVSDPAEMDLTHEPYEHWIFAHPDRNGCRVSGAEYFIPFDSKWSILVAEFEIVPHPAAGYALRLTILRVP